LYFVFIQLDDLVEETGLFNIIFNQTNKINLPIKWSVDTIIDDKPKIFKKSISFYKMGPFTNSYFRFIEKHLVLKEGGYINIFNYLKTFEIHDIFRTSPPETF